MQRAEKAKESDQRKIQFDSEMPGIIWEFSRLSGPGSREQKEKLEIQPVVILNTIR
jgi:hypothetical protein